MMNVISGISHQSVTSSLGAYLLVISLTGVDSQKNWVAGGTLETHQELAYYDSVTKMYWFCQSYQNSVEKKVLAHRA